MLHNPDTPPSLIPHLRHHTHSVCFGNQQQILVHNPFYWKFIEVTIIHHIASLILLIKKQDNINDTRLVQHKKRFAASNNPV